MKKLFSGRILALIMMMCVVCSNFITASSLPEEAAADGSIEVKVVDFAEKTQLDLYKVASLNEKSQYDLFDEYKDSGADLSDLNVASKSQLAAEKLTEYAVKLEPEKSALVDSDGLAVFNEVEASNILYLICQKNNEEIISISPMLVLLPYYDDNEEMHKTAAIDAKYTDNRKESKGAIILNKTDDKNSPLADAVFKFEKKVYSTDTVSNSDNKDQYVWETVSEALVTDKNGQLVAEQLPLGEYRFTETKAPKGYILDSTPYDVVVKSEATIRVENNKYVPDGGTPVIITVVNNPVPVESSIVSEPPSSVPPTPDKPVVTGEDIAKFIIIGVIVAVSLVAVILLFVLGRKKKDDDDTE